MVVYYFVQYKVAMFLFSWPLVFSCVLLPVSVVSVVLLANIHVCCNFRPRMSSMSTRADPLPLFYPLKNPGGELIYSHHSKHLIHAADITHKSRMQWKNNLNMSLWPFRWLDQMTSNLNGDIAESGAGHAWVEVNSFIYLLL